MHARWNSLLALAFGALFAFRCIVIFPALATIPPGAFPAQDVVASAQEAQRFLVVLFFSNAAYAIFSIVCAAALAMQKRWALRLWATTCVCLLIGIAVETVALDLRLTEYLAETAIALVSLFICARSLKANAQTAA